MDVLEDIIGPSKASPPTSLTEEETEALQDHTTNLSQGRAEVLFIVLPPKCFCSSLLTATPGHFLVSTLHVLGLSLLLLMPSLGPTFTSAQCKVIRLQSTDLASGALSLTLGGSGHRQRWHAGIVLSEVAQLSSCLLEQILKYP